MIVYTVISYFDATPNLTAATFSNRKLAEKHAMQIMSDVIDEDFSHLEEDETSWASLCKVGEY